MIIKLQSQQFRLLYHLCMKSIYTGNHRSISQYLDITIIIKINIFFQRALEPVLVHIHILWELILINEVCSVIKIYFSQLIIYISLFLIKSIVVIANEPSTSSEVVQALVRYF